MEGKTYVIANTQFGRPSAIGKWKRPYKSVDEMTRDIINNWNNTVTRQDRVVVVGNFAWDPKTAYDTLLALKAKEIIIVLGENDDPIVDLWRRKNLPKGVKIAEHLYLNEEVGAVFSYWPMKEWPNKKKGWYHITGYPNRKHKTVPKNKIINCSLEQCNYKPQDIKSIIGLLEEIKDKKN